MSTAEILSLISTICFVLAAICFVAAVVFWFAFQIPKVIGDLSGRTAKKSIARMRASNERAGGQGYRPSATNLNRGKLTEMVPPSEGQAAEPKRDARSEPEERTAANARIPGVPEVNKADAVGEPTQSLEGNETAALPVDENDTVSLGVETIVPAKRTGGKQLTILDEVMLIHTDEVI